MLHILSLFPFARTRTNPFRLDFARDGLAMLSLATWGYVAVGVGTAAAGILGKQKAPKAAELKMVDPQAEQRKALQGNLASQDDIEQLLTRSNAFTQDQANSLMERAMPGYAKIAQKFMSQADGMLSDPYSVPKEVTDNLTRLAAERGINTGVRGQAGDFSLARDFGINSLQYGQARLSQAQSILQTIAGLAPRVNPMSPMAFYITPAQQMTATVQNNTGQFNAQQAQNNANAAASNANASMWGNLVANAAGAMGGMASKSGSTAKPAPVAGDYLA